MTQPLPPSAVVPAQAAVTSGSASASIASQSSLAASFYAAQALLAAVAIRDVIQIWGQLNLGDVRSSWPAIRTALAALIRDRYGMSVTQASTYYGQARWAAGVRGVAPIVIPDPLPDPLITATLDSTGPWSLLGRIKQGQTVEQADQNTAVTMSGAASRLIQNGARQVILQSVAEDAKAVGWRRVTSANPCAFCAMLSGRGTVFRSEESASFEAHNHCQCVAAPAFSKEDAEASKDNDLARQWKQATKGLSGADALKAWRTHWDAQQNRDGVRVLPAA